VPAELSVVGFDDLPFAADLNPSLTTVRLPLESMGRQAMELLLADVDDEAPARVVHIDAELVERGSTGRVPGA
jgi:LacI family transcriptional regulator